MLFKKGLTLLLATSLVMGLGGCGDEEDYEEYDSARESTSEAASDSTRTSDGSAVSNALGSQNVKSTPMGEPGTWSIFVYLCGSDLESEAGMASGDLYEMVEATASDTMRYVVQTGGSLAWNMDISESNIERCDVHDNDLYGVEVLDQANMGDAATLADFLTWGVENYPAEHMGVILWDHGSGSINGVCFDENYEYDSLSLAEIDRALASTYEHMTDQFEFIGFDACLMSTLESAAVLSNYARYMYASEETESGYGWNYTVIGDYLAEYPEADGADLGKVVCDSFYEDCEVIEEEASCTLAVTDLSKILPLVEAFETYAGDIYAITESDADFSETARAFTQVDNFGGNNKSEGYTNMVDLGGLISAGSGVSGNATAALAALEDAVIYQVKGSNHASASGLATYYPLQVQGSTELSTFKDVCTSAYYLGLVDKIAYAYGNGASISGYDNSWILEDTEEANWDYLDEDVELGYSPFITFSQEPTLDSNGIFSFVLDEEGLYNAASVQAYVLWADEEEGEYISFGLTSDVMMDWSTGEGADNFDGYWVALPDGQTLCMYLVGEYDGYDVFTAPIMLNGEETNLRFAWDYETGDIYIVDIWDGVEDSGAAARPSVELKDGDIIIPLYDAFNEEGEDFYYVGEEYTYGKEDVLQWIFLPDGTYYYGFSIDDIYGDYLDTDMVTFYVDGENIYFGK